MILILTALFSSLGLYGCQSKSTSWSEQGKKLFLKGCLANTPMQGMTLKENNAYCQCALQETMEQFPDINQTKGDPPQEFVKNTARHCFTKVTGYEIPTK